MKRAEGGELARFDRRAARAENTYRRFVGEVARRTALAPARAERALGIVVDAICRRIHP